MAGVLSCGAARQSEGGGRKVTVVNHDVILRRPGGGGGCRREGVRTLDAQSQIKQTTHQ